MISVVCVFSDEKILNNVLLKSLNKQTSEFELITLDNRNNRFQSAAEALNYGGAKATGDYIMFIHQDMWLFSETCLEEIEKDLKSLTDVGVAGVAGVIDATSREIYNLKWAIEDFGVLQRLGGRRVKKIEEVLTLDECVLIVPKPVFKKLKFDSKTFDGWDCYGTDYCLSVRQLGYKSYVLPAYSSHSTLRASFKRWEFKGLLKYQSRIYSKYKHNYRSIASWMSTISRKQLMWNHAVSILGPFYSKIFPVSFDTINKEFSGCNSLLDLGCGFYSHLQCSDKKLSVGVELFEPFLQESRRKAIHHQYIQADIRDVEFKPDSFDAVAAINVIEHLTKQEGIELINKMKSWARKKVILSTPNGYQPQEAYGDNPFQTCKTGWTARELEERGFTVRGLSGYKKLRGDNGLKKYKPAFVWEIISDLTQKVVYYYKDQAFQLMATYHVK